MDTSTINLLISTVGVVASGLIGAGITGHFNNIANKAAREGEREMWTLEKDHSRRETLLNQKRTVYQQLLKDIDGFHLLLTRAYNIEPVDFSLEDARLAEETLTTQVTEVMLFTDDEQLESAINTVCSQLADTLGVLTECRRKGLAVSPTMQATYEAVMETNRRTILNGFREDLSKGPTT